MFVIYSLALDLHYTERLGCMELGLMILLKLESKMCHVQMEIELIRKETELLSTVRRLRQATSSWSHVQELPKLWKPAFSFSKLVPAPADQANINI